MHDGMSYQPDLLIVMGTQITGACATCTTRPIDVMCHIFLHHVHCTKYLNAVVMHLVELCRLLQGVRTLAFNFRLINRRGGKIITCQAQPLQGASFEKSLNSFHLLFQEFHFFVPTIGSGLGFAKLDLQICKVINITRDRID